MKLQECGDRHYKLQHCDVTLKRQTLEDLKDWNVAYPTILYDSKYVKKLLMDVFGLKCLVKSSVGGNMARNANVQHEALDKIKLKFVRGKEEIQRIAPFRHDF